MLNDKLHKLRAQMKKEGIDAYILPSADPHQSEYLPECWQIRQWISGFTGSAGTALVTMEHAGLWTDSRYFIQAEQQLSSSSFQLHKHLNRANPSYADWIVEHMPAHSVVAIDGILFTVSQVNALEKKFDSKNIELRLTDDYISKVWDDRPSLPTKPIFEHHISFAGQSRAEKISAIRERMLKSEAQHHLITKLDDIAWTFNLRGNDVACNPVFIAYAIISKDNSFLFVDESKLSESLKNKLTSDKITIKAYNDVFSFLKAIPPKEKILAARSSLSISCFDSIAEDQLVLGENIPMHLKAIKNETELNHVKECMINDGVALTKAFMWLETTLKKRTIKEVEFAQKIAECRASMGNYHGESFDAIVGYKGNGAIVHYKPEPETCADIKPEGVLLCDSGGQYFNGTTDITRTMSFDVPSSEVQQAYTRVLKGHIALASAVFPEGTTGGQLDLLARKSLWENGMNYLHGTGHGVGFFLNVHEPPQGFSPKSSTVHQVGMLTSNEPGYYEEGQFGIRIENLVFTKKAAMSGFLDFETVTLFPIDTSMIEMELMDASEIEWLNNYHKIVLEKLSPKLNAEQQEWMTTKCESIGR